MAGMSEPVRKNGRFSRKVKFFIKRSINEVVAAKRKKRWPKRVGPALCSETKSYPSIGHTPQYQLSDIGPVRYAPRTTAAAIG
ncbi:hypothetical protein FHS21_004151 [Phyllobacterium trifolii]|uniref:Uncharacterized protein n=1 Tax=Phyllobacterium trifolii TaxID=300193 RepID=A0A839UGR7_9HYPH|nr:hypothetical protein [Phyllobacterium trifolii]